MGILDFHAEPSVTDRQRRGENPSNYDVIIAMLITMLICTVYKSDCRVYCTCSCESSDCDLGCLWEDTIDTEKSTRMHSMHMPQIAHSLTCLHYPQCMYVCVASNPNALYLSNPFVEFLEKEDL